MCEEKRGRRFPVELTGFEMGKLLRAREILGRGATEFTGVETTALRHAHTVLGLMACEAQSMGMGGTEEARAVEKAENDLRVLLGLMAQENG